jgi:DNA integrity scanning protein DisA with diadenylate cyclase activity
MTPVHNFWLLDVIDILIVAGLFYRLLSLVRGTRSAQMIVGLLLIALVGVVATTSTCSPCAGSSPASRRCGSSCS